MAGVDKIYGTAEQYKEFTAWLEKHKPEYMYCIYPLDETYGPIHTISNFPEEADMWLVVHCPMEFIIKRIKEQYGMED